MMRDDCPDAPILRKHGKAPWHRGPTAFAIGSRSNEIMERLAGLSETHLSLRRTAEVLGISTQPLRVWYREGWIKKGPAGRKFPVDELKRFVLWLKRYAKPEDMRQRVRRFSKIKGKHQPLPRAWDLLRKASFEWPKGQATLTPSQLAALVGCSPSLVTKAIEDQYLDADRPGRVHWHISKRQWNRRGFAHW